MDHGKKNGEIESDLIVLRNVIGSDSIPLDLLEEDSGEEPLFLRVGLLLAPAGRVPRPGRFLHLYPLL